MESNSVVLCDNLIKWLKTLDLKAKHGTPSELSDGVAMAEALTQIEPGFFTPAWNSKIKTDVGTNKRLKISNLKKILEGVMDYHQDLLNLSLQEFSRPDVGNIADKADPSDLGRLLQLVLSCAVNCNKKEEYITRIMEMELSCQGSIMQAIQELETLTLGGTRATPQDPAPPAQTDEEVREALAQRCHDLDKQVKVLLEEKMTLLSEVSRLTAAQEAAAGPEAELDDAGTSLGPPHVGTLRYSQMRAQVDLLKDELYKVELQRDDQRARADALEREVAMVKLRNEELQDELHKLEQENDIHRARGDALDREVTMIRKRNETLQDVLSKLEQENVNQYARGDALEKEVTLIKLRNKNFQVLASENVTLRDEVDALRERAAKVDLLEASVSSYRIRMDECVDLRRQVKILEGEKEEYMRRAIEKEQDALRFQARCGQLDLYRNQVKELNEKLDQEIDTVSKFEIENKKLNSQAAALQRERDTLLQERDTLKETLEELRCSTVSTITADANSSNVSRELMPPETAERLMRLEAEIKTLRENEAQQQDHAATQALLEDYAKRLEKLRTMNREANQRIMELEAAQDAPNQRLDAEDSQRKSLQVEELQRLLNTERGRVAKLQEEVAARDSELAALQDRYNKSIEKAKQVVESLNPRTATGQQSISEVTLGYPQGAGAAAPAAVTNNKEWSGSSGSSRGALAAESRLLASAWHQLGARCHRDAVDARLRLLSAGHSFLARQRMNPPRARAPPVASHSHPAPAPAH